MQAIILAAGEGSRMRPLTASRPKVMLPVAGRPFLEHIILRARTAGADRIVLVVGYCGEAVRFYPTDAALARWCAAAHHGQAMVVYD